MASTPAERRALLFLSGLLCLGVAVRAAGALRREPPPAVSRAALARQIEAVDSARKAARAAKSKGRGGGRVGRGTVVADAPSDSARRRSSRARARRQATPDTLHGAAIDLDTASTETLERLPRIGPALAKRIVEDRERNGAFGSLEGFQRVRGVGPGLARTLAERVTFSASRRPFRAAIPLDRAPR